MVTLLNKPGWKTTEFWLAVLTIAAILAQEHLGIHLDPAEVIALAGASAGYAHGRGTAKTR